MVRFAWAVSGFLHPLSWWLIGFRVPVIAGNVCLLFFGVLLPPLLCWGLHGVFGSRRTVARPLSFLMFWTGIFEWCSHLICYSSPITRCRRSRLVFWSTCEGVTCFLRKGKIFSQEISTFFLNFYINLLPFFFAMWTFHVILLSRCSPKYLATFSLGISVLFRYTCGQSERLKV